MNNIEVTNDIKMEIVKYFGYEHCPDQKDFYLNEAPDNLFKFYYYCMKNGLDVCDADRYASINTIVGYDIGLENYKKLDGYLWCEKDFDLMDLVGNDDNKEIIEDAINILKLDIDLSKCINKEIESYVYYV